MDDRGQNNGDTEKYIAMVLGSQWSKKKTLTILDKLKIYPITNEMKCSERLFSIYVLTLEGGGIGQQ